MSRLAGVGVRSKRPVMYCTAAAAVLYLGSVSFTDEYFAATLSQVLLVAAGAQAWSIIGGLGGQLSLGHSVFFGVGAYSGVILLIRYEVNPWVGMVTGVLLACAIATLIGLIVFGLRGVYFALASFAFAVVFETVVTAASDFTGGPVGLSVPLLPSPTWADMQFTTGWPYVLLAGLIVVASITTTYLIKRSHLGLELRAIKENELAAQAIGVNARFAKLVALVISAALTAIIGSLYSQTILFIDPSSAFGLVLSLQFVIFAMVGGAERTFGPAIAGIVLGLSIEEMRVWGSDQGIFGLETAAYGLLLVLIGLRNRIDFARIGARIGSRFAVGSKVGGPSS